MKILLAGMLLGSLLVIAACGGDDETKGVVTPTGVASTPVAATTPAFPSVPMVTPTPQRAGNTRPASTAPLPAEAIPPGMEAVGVWSPDLTYVAVATFKRDVPGQTTLSVYNYVAGKPTKVYTGSKNGTVTFDQDKAFKDINGDKRPDLVYSVYTGGNCWACDASEALLGNAAGSFEVARFQKAPGAAAVPGRPIDVNNDGVYEWLMLDVSWELREFCHACSPASWLVYAWNGSEYADASPRFAMAVDDQRQSIQKMQKQEADPKTLDPTPPAADATCNDRDGYLSNVISRYLDYVHTERAADAVRLLAQLRSYNFGNLAAKRDFIVATLTGQATTPYTSPC